jgi:hypothetical protein
VSAKGNHNKPKKVYKSPFVAVLQIREFVYVGSFYYKTLTSFEQDGFVYWTIGDPVTETTIISKCKKDTSENLLIEGILPYNYTSESRRQFLSS